MSSENRAKKRVILYTGKGGVGKTSVAAATALRAAQRGYRTIVMSTDIAHSLGDSFDMPLGSTPCPIVENLWGQELDVLREINVHWGTIQSWVTALMTWQGLDEVVAEEMAILPGMEELSSLLYITYYYDKPDYEVIIVDCAPTGETLQLLSFPDIARWWMERIFPLERKAAYLLRPLAKGLLGFPAPEDEVFDAIGKLFKDLERMRAILTNLEETSVRLVMNPEKMVIRETQRTFTYLNLYNYFTDLIVCNRVIPEQVVDSYFTSWKEIQGRHFKTIEERFAPLPIRTIPLLPQEAVGIPMLQAIGEALFGADDPTQIFFHKRVQQIEREDGNYVLAISLPFVSRGDISLMRHGDELVVQVGSYRRNVILPRMLIAMDAQEAKFFGDTLRITFKAQSSTEEA